MFIGRIIIKESLYNLRKMDNPNISVECIERNFLDIYTVTVAKSDSPEFFGLLMDNSDAYFSDPMNLARSAGMVFNSGK